MSQYSEIIDKSVIKELKEIKEKLQSQNRFELDTRDRVDISLFTYNAMRDEIEELEKELAESIEKNAKLRRLLEKIGIPIAKLDLIDISGVEIVKYDNPQTCSIQHVVRFDVPCEELNKVGE